MPSVEWSSILSLLSLQPSNGFRYTIFSFVSLVSSLIFLPFCVRLCCMWVLFYNQVFFVLFPHKKLTRTRQIVVCYHRAISSNTENHFSYVRLIIKPNRHWKIRVLLLLFFCLSSSLSITKNKRIQFAEQLCVVKIKRQMDYCLRLFAFCVFGCLVSVYWAG